MIAISLIVLVLGAFVFALTQRAKFQQRFKSEQHKTSQTRKANAIKNRIIIDHDVRERVRERFKGS